MGIHGVPLRMGMGVHSFVAVADGRHGMGREERLEKEGDVATQRMMIGISSIRAKVARRDEGR